MISLVGGELYQWDTGRIVKVVPDENVTVHEVHFSTKRMDYAYVLKTYTEDGVTYCAIPNIILQQTSRLLCYEVCENSDGEETIADVSFDIIKRNKPEDYVYTEQEHFTVVALENRLAKVEESAHIHKNKEVLDNITNENVETWNSNAEIAHTHENKEQLDTITETDLETWRNPNSSVVTGGAQVGILFKDLEVTTTLAEDASEWTGASSKPFKCTFRPSPGQTVYANVEGLGVPYVTTAKISPQAFPLGETIIGNYSVVNSKLKTWYNDADSLPPTPNDTDAEWCFVFDDEDYDVTYLTPDLPSCTLYTKTPGTYKITVTILSYSIEPESVMKMYDVRPYTLAEYGTYANWKDLTKSGKYDLWEVAVKKTDYYNGVYLKEVSGTKYIYWYHTDQKYDSDSGTFTNTEYTLTYDTATETVACSDATLNPETDIIISIHRDQVVLSVPDKATSLGEATPDKVGKMLTAVDAGGTYNKWQNFRYQYQWVDVPKTKTFYADFDVRDGKNIITKVTPDEIVAAYESGQNVIARIVSQLYMSGYVTLVRPFIIERNREISFSDVVVFGAVTSGKMVQLYYDYDSKKWYFDISDWLLDKKYADEKYIDGYWGTDVAGKYLAISNAGVVYAANPPSGSSNTAVTYTEQTLTDAQKAQARTNIGASSSEDIVQADWNQNDITASDYIRNRTHGLENSTLFNITWDRSTDGRDKFDVLGDGAFVYYKISDEVFTDENLDGANIEIGSETFIIEEENINAFDEIVMVTVNNEPYIISTSTLTPPGGVFPNEESTFPSTGTYCLYNSSGENIHLWKAQTIIQQLPMMYLPDTVQRDAGKTLIYREDANEIVYKATAHVSVAQTVNVTKISTIISEQIVAEAMSEYEVIITGINTNDGTETISNGVLGQCISGLLLGVGQDRRCNLRGSYKVDVGSVSDFDDNDITIVVKAGSNVAISPHAYYVNQTMIAPEVDWTGSIDNVQDIIPTTGAVYDGLKTYAQTYTTYEENISEEPIVIKLQNQTFYNFGTTPKITIDRSGVVATGTYCGFIFKCGDTATELYEKANDYGHARGYSPWNVHCSIKPHRSYKCIIQHGEPFLTEYIANDINAFESVLREVRFHTYANAKSYFIPSTIQTGENAIYTKYSSLKLKIGVDPEVFEQAYNEIVTANETAQLRKAHEQIPFTLSAYTAVGGEPYYPANSTTSNTATEGQHLIKFTVPPFSEDYGDVHYYSEKWYICVKNGAAATLNYKTGKTYALSVSNYSTKRISIYILPSTDDSVVTINTDLDYKTCTKHVASSGDYISISSSKYLPGVLQSVTWNKLKESETQDTTSDNG